MESAPNLSALISEITNLKQILRKGIAIALGVELSRILLKYVFGYNAGFKVRVSMLWILWGGFLGPFSPISLRNADILNDVRNWLRRDSPYQIPIVRLKLLVRLLVYSMPGLCVILDWYHFVYWIFVAHVPVATMVCEYIFIMSQSLGVTWRQEMVQLVEWMLNERAMLLPYGIVAYVLILRGQSIPFAIFILSSHILQIRWPSMSQKTQLICRTCLWAIPLCLKMLLNLMLLPVWLYRHKLKMPYWRLSWQVNKAWQEWAQEVWVWNENDKVWQERNSIWSSQSDQYKYKYQPLQQGEIRILMVRRKASTGELICNLEHASLELAAACRYDAISYTWGAPQDQQMYRISVDGKWIDIRRNAYELLQDRACTFETRTVWIDCICINQLDNHEKSFQVPLMAEIYRRANRTIIWLGQSPDSQPAFSLLLDLLERTATLRKDTPAVIRRYADPRNKTRANRFAYFEHLDPRFRSLARLLQHEYFRRVWIFQEVVFSKTLHIRSGGTWIQWTDFARAIRLFSDLATYKLVGREEFYKHFKEPCGLGDISRIDLSRTSEQIGVLERPPLCVLLANLWMSKATDPRDMIYSLVNLSQDAGLPELAPDYVNKDWPELYIDVASLFLNRNELHKILGIAGIGYGKESESETIRKIPSWVPDWRCVPLVTPLFLPALSNKPYNACHGKPSRFRLMDRDRQTLVCRGIFVDTISKVTREPFSGPNLANENVDDILARQLLTELEAQDLTESNLPPTYINGTQREEAFWRTLIGDTTMSALSCEQFDELDTLGLPRYGSGFAQHRPAPAEYSALFKQERRLRLNLRETNDLLNKSTTAAGYHPTEEDAARIRQLSKEWQTTYENHDSRFTDSFTSSSGGRKFAIIGNKYMALVPPFAKVGDHICVLFGLAIPFVLRNKGSIGGETIYSLVGESYVHGIMDGEAVVNGGGRGEMDIKMQ